MHQALAHFVEGVNVVHGAEMIGVLHAEDDADAAFGFGSGEIFGPIDADEVFVLCGDEAVPFVEPVQRLFVRSGGFESYGWVKYVNAGAAQFLEVGFGESAGDLLPAIEQAPVQREQAEHVDDIGLRDEAGGSC